MTEFPADIDPEPGDTFVDDYGDVHVVEKVLGGLVEFENTPQMWRTEIEDHLEDGLWEAVQDPDRIVDCEECGQPLDTFEPGHWKATNDEQWWHVGCFDKVEKAEELRDQILGLMVPEGEDDGLSSDFHDGLDAAQGLLANVVETEKLKRAQKIGHYGVDDE